MKNIAIIILFVLIGIVIYQNFPTEEVKEYEKTPEGETPESQKDIQLKYSKDNSKITKIEIQNKEEKIEHTITIEDVRKWMKDNWDIFKEPPKVATRQVKPDNFTFFDKTAKLSPDQDKMAFSVNDYAVATTVSFILIMDTESGNLSMVKDPTRGSVEEFHWSKDSRFLAYPLNTPRASGDMLSVDDTENMEKKFTLEEEDLLEILEQEKGTTFMPGFRDLKWKDDRLHFTTDSHENENMNWSVKYSGEDLRKEEI
ncbi:MAG: hypothetical protein ACQESA_02470 [Patescibacteria group bacterium]